MAYDAAALKAIQLAEANRIKAAAAGRKAGSTKPTTPVVNNSNYGPGAGEGRTALSSRDIALAAMNAAPREGVNPDGSWTNVMSGFPSVLRNGTPNPASRSASRPAPQQPAPQNYPQSPPPYNGQGGGGYPSQGPVTGYSDEAT